MLQIKMTRKELEQHYRVELEHLKFVRTHVMYGWYTDKHVKICEDLVKKLKEKLTEMGDEKK